MPEGMIIKGIGGFYYVKTENGLFECKARGIFRKDEQGPLPGDNVLNIGIDELKEVLKGHISVFAGPSGVGKSTILNSIHHNDRMETGEISKKNERGKHTTRHAELFEIDGGGYVVDTPGFSSFEIREINHRELAAYYPEFDACSDECRFSGCFHMAEPGCAVKEAVETGIVNKGRYDRYMQIFSVLKFVKEW